ncbi:conserved hypothetical protein [Methanocella paludicola SANAE]|uniref:DUF2178 domain-containing protein n=1 Tax=Methanocella paludicola (strain DSM 17711 / JCM 13418 / NBRC 101707 / SANAE) TaxID=304371 RepID=D1YVJ1_METPS|nr:hypothetical protein [Methanocella paludicola]BAI60463.1 conserved hypothetical protein [Methanocella paludicola SANAE]
MVQDPVKNYNLTMLIGIFELLMLAAILIMRSSANFPEYDAIALVAAIGLITFGGNLFYFLGMRKPVLDERTRKIGTIAMTYSWYATMIAICILVMIYYASPFRVMLDAGQIFGIILFVMVVSMVAFIVYFNAKGDVE